MKRALDTPDESARPLKQLKSRDSSWTRFDQLCTENAALLTAPTPELFAPPKDSARVAFLSSSEFDAALPAFCEQIRATIRANDCNHVVLWLQPLGKSNFWMALRCWPYLKTIIDEVWYYASNRDPYGGGSYSNAHLYLDDALFTGEQASKLILESSCWQPVYAMDGTSDHLWIVAAMAMSDEAEERIRLCLRKADEFACEDEEEDEEEDEHEHFACAFVAHCELTLKEEDRYVYYTGFKVPDNFSIPLERLVQDGVIPGLTLSNLATEGILRVQSPQPPYRNLPLVLEGKALTNAMLQVLF